LASRKISWKIRLFRLKKLFLKCFKPFVLLKKNRKKIPVIAGGGIYTGADIRKFIEMGASGVQMATRFVATNECDASIKFKNAYIEARKEDLRIIKSPVGMPGRAIANTFLDDVEQGKKNLSSVLITA